MAIDLRCDGCGKRFSLRDELAGKKVRCTGCQTIMRAPMTTWVDPAPVPSPPSSPAPTPAHAANVQVVVNHPERGRPANGLGVAGSIFGILALLICWIPLVNLLVIPMALLGGLLAAVGLIVALSNKQSGPGWAIAGISTNATALLVMLLINFVVFGSVAAEANKQREAARARGAGPVKALAP